MAVKAEPYLAWRADESLPRLARRFLAWSVIAESCGDIRAAAFGGLSAAWSCDDERLTEASSRCRERALFLFDRIPKETLDQEEFGEISLISIDLLRRTGRFQEAIRRCWNLREQSWPEGIEKVLTLQEKLAESRDSACYHVSGTRGDYGPRRRELTQEEIARSREEAERRMADAERREHEARKISQETAMAVWAKVVEGVWTCSHCGLDGTRDKDFRLSQGMRTVVICQRCGWPQE